MINYFKMFRIDRLILYYFPFFIGIYFNNLTISQNIINSFIFISLFELMIVLNDINDVVADKYNKKTRPSLKKWENFIYLFSFIYIYFNIISFNYNNFYFYYYMFLAFLLSIFYNCPPFRIKKYFPFNNLILGTTASFIYLWGSNGYFQYKYFFLIFIYFSLASFFKDRKDIKGDKIDNITTFPIILEKYNISDLNTGYKTITIILYFINIITLIYFSIGFIHLIILTFLHYLLYKSKEEYQYLSMLFIIAIYLFIII